MSEVLVLGVVLEDGEVALIKPDRRRQVAERHRAVKYLSTRSLTVGWALPTLQVKVYRPLEFRW